MNNKEKALTKKYFVEQKLKEITVTLLILLFIVVFPYIVNQITTGGYSCTISTSNITTEDYEIYAPSIESCHKLHGYSEKESFLESLGSGLMQLTLFLIFLLIISIILSCLYFLLRDWISLNWKIANKRARKELRNKK